MTPTKFERADIHSADDLVARSRRRLPRFVFDFIEGGAESETALALNRAAFARKVVVPRVGGVSAGDMGIALFGERYAAPVGVAPIGLADLVAPGADLALAGAAAAADLPYIASAAAGTGIATIAERTGRPPWFQLYAPRDPAVTRAMLRHAASVGVATLVITLDVPVPARRLRDLRNGLSIPLRVGLPFAAQAAFAPGWTWRRLRAGPIEFPNFKSAGLQVDRRAFADVMAAQTGGRLDWDALARLRDDWRGTVALKGILSPADAIRARAIGADGVIVSNHGGRQFDAAPAPLDVVASIREAVPDIAVMLDSGVRSGTDVVRAVHAGADCVFMARPWLHALAGLGEAGPPALARHITDDAARALALSGAPSWAGLRRDGFSAVP